MNPGYGQFGGAPPPMGGAPSVAQNFGAPPHAGAGVKYEFNQFENTTIATVGGRARTSGTISVVFGIFGLLAGIAMLAATIIVAANDGDLGPAPVILVTTVLPTSIVYLIVGLSLRGAGKSLVDVTQTQGNDVQHMMTSIGKLKTAFQLEALLSIGAFVVGIILAFVLAAIK